MGGAEKVDRKGIANTMTVGFNIDAGGRVARRVSLGWDTNLGDGHIKTVEDDLLFHLLNEIILDPTFTFIGNNYFPPSRNIVPGQSA